MMLESTSKLMVAMALTSLQVSQARRCQNTTALATYPPPMGEGCLNLLSLQGLRTESLNEVSSSSMLRRRAPTPPRPSNEEASKDSTPPNDRRYGSIWVPDWLESPGYFKSLRLPQRSKYVSDQIEVLADLNADLKALAFLDLITRSTMSSIAAFIAPLRDDLLAMRRQVFGLPFISEDTRDPYHPVILDDTARRRRVYENHCRFMSSSSMYD